MTDKADWRPQALDALNEGVVDWLGGLSEALAHIDEFKLVEKAQKGMSGKIAYGLLKEEMWRESVAFLEKWTEDNVDTSQKEIQRRRDRDRRETKIQQWERSKAKL